MQTYMVVKCVVVFLHNKIFFWKVPIFSDKGLPVYIFSLASKGIYKEQPSYFIVSFYSEFDKVIDIFGDTLYNINMQKLSGLENQEGRLIVLKWLTKTLNTVVCFTNCFCFVRKSLKNKISLRFKQWEIFFGFIDFQE